MKTYWVYEDDPTKRVRIHLADCHFCNNGQGVQETRLPDNRWCGPFKTKEDAIERALKTPDRDVAGRWFCLRSVGKLRQRGN